MEEDPLSQSPVGQETEDSSTSLILFVKLESEAETSEVESSESEVLVNDAILPREEDPGDAQVGIPARRKPYVCKYCEEAFGDRYSLKLHAAKHKGEKRFRCTECGKACLHKHELMYHIRKNHTGERPYACTQCDSAFIVKSHLMSHAQIHATQKAFVCGQCGKMYLARLVKSHTGSEPFRCGQCEKAYAGNSNLTKHVKVHAGARPFVCNYCKRTFACKADLATHVRVHTLPMRPGREGVLTQEGADKTPEVARRVPSLLRLRQLRASLRS